MSALLNIAVAEPSAIIRSGLEAVLKRIPGFRIQIIEIATAELLQETLRSHKPDMLIINPSLPGYYTIQLLKEETGCTEMKCIACCMPSLIMPCCDLTTTRSTSMTARTRSATSWNAPYVTGRGNRKRRTADAQRTRKEIVVCVVKGMTNREIADRLFLSTHTVVTHRRNIARKLQVHSASGLTVYAIVNKLVELNDIKL